MKNFLVCVLAVGLATAGCSSVYNTAMEKLFGVEKRQLLKGAVESVSKDQKKTQEEFKDALTQLKELYGFKGGTLESKYNKLKSAYTSAQAQADGVHERIANMNSIAKSMFSEWEKEIRQYKNPAFADNSRKQLADTKARFAQLSATVKASEATMKPVLQQLNDHVLFLKHNLNASAIGSLKTEASSIESQIEGLIGQMNQSINEADAFIQTLLKE